MSEPARANLGGWFAYRTDPETDERSPITRQKVCGCGKTFQQRMLSSRFMEIVERQSVQAVTRMMQDIPDLFVPVNCPPCESKALGYARPEIGTWMLPVRHRMQDRERFARNLAQLCAAWNKPMDDETSQVFWRALERTLTDDEFERGIISAVRTERKWPTPSVIASYGRAA